VGSWIKCKCGCDVHTNLFAGADVYQLIRDADYNAVEDPVDRDKLADLFFKKGKPVYRCSGCSRIIVEWNTEVECSFYALEKTEDKTARIFAFRHEPLAINGITAEEALIAKRDILNMGLDDYTGLHEILWHFFILWPEMEIGKKYHLADTAIRLLLCNGSIRLLKAKSTATVQESRLARYLQRFRVTKYLQMFPAFRPTVMVEYKPVICVEDGPSMQSQVNEILQSPINWSPIISDEEWPRFVLETTETGGSEYMELCEMLREMS
jgi:hypothetical protein